MKIFDGYKSCAVKVKGSVVALGNFDGFHLAHQELLKRLLLMAKRFNTKSVVYTFNPHPICVLNPERPLLFIENQAQKAKRIFNFGVDFIINEPFIKEFTAISSKKFIRNVLLSSLAVKGVVVGDNYHFGRGPKRPVPMRIWVDPSAIAIS